MISEGRKRKRFGLFGGLEAVVLGGRGFAGSMDALLSLSSLLHGPGRPGLLQKP